MKRYICIFTALIAFAAAHAIEVNEGELKATNTETEAIQFENYVGPHSVIESASSITEIGASLGRRVAENPDENAVYDPSGKYTLIHAVNADDSGKLDADIFVLNETAGVDHIRNLRRILTGFLESAYNYSHEDAETIALFVTVYNAVYRGEMATFTEKYKDSVVNLLDLEKIGLSTHWKEWAGKTQLVIPLGTFREDGTISVDTSTISDEKVIEALRKEDDKAVEQREKLNTIKEKESTDAAQKAKNAQKDATQKRNEGNKQGAATSAKTATEQQQIADRKRTEVQDEQKDIEHDKKALEKTDTAVDESNYLVGLFSADGKGSAYTLVTVDGATGTVVREAAVKQIRRDVVYAVHDIALTTADGEAKTFDELYLAICGENSGKSAVRLCLIDSRALEIQKESEETLSEHSPLVPTANGYCVIIVQDGKHYAAIYDKTLTLKHKSAVSVSPATPFNQLPQGILVSDSDGTPHLLKTDDLSTIW